MNAALENYAYARDARTQGPARKPVLYLDGQEIELPTKWEVCPVCEGEGKHVNPSIDCNGISAEDFDEDPEFAEAYHSGVYDQTCNRCGGRTTVPAVDWDALSAEQKAAYEEQLEGEARDYAEQLAEIRAGA